MSGSPAINRTMGIKEWGLLLALSILWGGSFFFVAVAVDALPPFTIVILRVGLAADLPPLSMTNEGHDDPRQGELDAVGRSQGRPR